MKMISSISLPAPKIKIQQYIYVYIIYMYRLRSDYQTHFIYTISLSVISIDDYQGYQNIFQLCQVLAEHLKEYIYVYNYEIHIKPQLKIFTYKTISYKLTSH